MATLGAAIAVRNETDLLGRCLDATIGFDEVVVLDLDSNDNPETVAIPRSAGVVSHKAVPFVELARERQLEIATTEWVLFVDPDEELPVGWTTAVRAVLDDTPPEVAGYWVRYETVAFGRPMRHVDAGAAKVALVRRSAATSPPDPRPHVPLSLAGRAEWLPATVPVIKHHAYRSVAERIEKLTRYASGAGVSSNNHEGIGPLTCFKMLWGSVVMTRAWKDGTPGIVVATMGAIGDYLGLLKRWEETGRPEMEIPPRTAALLEAGRIGHAVQWWARRWATGR